MAKSSLLAQIRRDIQQGVWAPAQAITQQQFADFYQVSRIPVRDAMALLAADGWLQRLGKASYQIMPLCAAQALELAEIRAQLEPLALQLALPTLSFAHLGQARDILVQIAQSPELSPWQLGQLNWQFHYALYQSCQRPFLLQLLEQLQQKAAMYLGYQHAQLAYGDVSQQQHVELLHLLETQQWDAALQLLRQHIEVAGQQLAHHLAG